MRFYLILCTLVFFAAWPAAGKKYELPSIRFAHGKLVYTADSLGNNIPDYSYCGYKSSNEPIPYVPPKVFVPATEDDATQAIQRAIDYVAGLPVSEDGFRGAVLLDEGVYRLSGRLKIQHSGIVLRGKGEKTIIRATGQDRQTLIRIFGNNDRKTGTEIQVADKYVPVGAKTFRIENTSGLSAGMQLLIRRPSTQNWIDKLGMNEFGGETSWLGWKPGRYNVEWERTIEKIEGNTIWLDAPITTAIDREYDGAVVSTVNWPGRIDHIGIENLTLESEFDAANLKDENHCWFAITMENTTNAWVRQVSFRHFAGSAVALFETANKITVEDCISTQPVSEIAGQRRNTFFTIGQQTLFLRCYAEKGCHDFSTGFLAAGPNAFVQCRSVLPFGFSGAADSWASGVLFDIVEIDGQALSFNNRGQDGQGAGWTAANSMMWQCSAARIECFAPPTAQNYAYGAWAQFAGNGLWYEANSHISPRSLFFAQLAERTGKSINQFQQELVPFAGESTSSPTIEQAAEFTRQSVAPPIQLKEFILQAGKRNPISSHPGNAISAFKLQETGQMLPEQNVNPELINGVLVFNGKLIAGSRFEEPWWRGVSRPYATKDAKPAITRYVPGRTGHGYTDDLGDVLENMEQVGAVVFEHNYGLWYDRRRDDHERVRRMDADVWAPFYEQPFARSGMGEAWDRLSKYDLTKYNPWYWSRLKEFAQLAAGKGKFLFHQNYFQHNILEAGAHWADSPWRPANSVNNTGFPEPPPYAGDKRIYLAEQFYDISHPVRRELHRKYIRQCLDNFKGQSNVIQSISAEFTGPLHFVKFWLDIIAEWERETGENTLVALSTTKDVQDAILADPVRSKLIDIIDIRYWAYRSDGSTYEPPGGVNLAPRQHARKINPGSRSFESVYRAVHEYRSKYPDKAVIYSESNFTEFGWAVLMAGGSLPVLPRQTDEQLLKAAAEMVPFSPNGEKVVGIKNPGKGMILFSKRRNSLDVNLSQYKGKFNVWFIDPDSGKRLEEQQTLNGGGVGTVNLPEEKDLIIWIEKK